MGGSIGLKSANVESEDGVLLWIAFNTELTLDSL
jgi:hypothetical protein